MVKVDSNSIPIVPIGSPITKKVTGKYVRTNRSKMTYEQYSVSRNIPRTASFLKGM